MSATLPVEVEARFKELEDHIDALQMVIAWLLVQVPGSDPVKFLHHQASQLSGDPKHQSLVAVLDLLCEDFAQLDAQLASEGCNQH